MPRLPLSRPAFHRRLGAIALMGGALLARLAGQTAPHADGDDPAPARAANASGPVDLPAGQHAFQVNCAGCHGPHGEGGRGPTLALPHLPRATSETAIVRIIAQGIHGTEMPPFKLDPAEARNLAAWVWHLGQLPPETVRGDPARGAVLYRTRGNCALCHSLQGYGGAIGPSLDDIGSRRGAAYLRRALVDPSAEVPQSFAVFREDAIITNNFLLVSLVTKDGTAWTGVRVNEDAFSIQIRDLANGFHSFLKSELAELDKQWGKSPMPSYAGAFSPAELDDLIAFLAAHKG
jgi:cytochrome c oxidase cbb3-type subunit 3